MCALSVAAAMGASPSFESPRHYQPVRQLVEAPQVPHPIAREEEVRARPAPTRDRPQIDLADLGRAAHTVAVRVKISNGARHRNILLVERAHRRLRVLMRRPSADGARRRRQRHRAFGHHHHGEQVAARVLDGTLEGVGAADRVGVELRLAFAVGSVAEDGNLLAARAVVDPLHVLRRRHLPQPSVLCQVRRPVLFHEQLVRRRARIVVAGEQRRRGVSDAAEHQRGAAEDDGDGGGGAAVDGIPPPSSSSSSSSTIHPSRNSPPPFPSVPPPASAGTTLASGTAARGASYSGMRHRERLAWR